MNFYFNYFSFIGGEGNLIVSVSVSTLAYCLFLKKLTFPTEFVDSFLKKLTLSPTSGAKKMLASCLALGERGGAVMCQLGKNEMRFYVAKHTEKYCRRGAHCASKSYGVVSSLQARYNTLHMMADYPKETISLR